MEGAGLFPLCYAVSEDFFGTLYMLFESIEGGVSGLTYV
jgi:hypothetical protein